VSCFERQFAGQGLFKPLTAVQGSSLPAPAIAHLCPPPSRPPSLSYLILRLFLTIPLRFLMIQPGVIQVGLLALMCVLLRLCAGCM
jgi:hypothetical protein